MHTYGLQWSPQVLVLILVVCLGATATAAAGVGLILRDRPQLFPRTTLAALEPVPGAVPFVWGLSPNEKHQDLPLWLDMLLDASYVHVCLQWLSDTLVLLYARSVTADSITGGLSDLLANLGDLTYSSPNRIRHGFNAFCVLSRGLDSIKQLA
jgi:hypothetical protein